MDEIKIPYNCLLTLFILLAIWACNCERVLVKLICLDKLARQVIGGILIILFYFYFFSSSFIYLFFLNYH